MPRATCPVSSCLGGARLRAVGARVTIAGRKGLQVYTCLLYLQFCTGCRETCHGMPDCQVGVAADVRLGAPCVLPVERLTGHRQAASGLCSKAGGGAHGRESATFCSGALREGHLREHEQLRACPHAGTATASTVSATICRVAAVMHETGLRMPALHEV